MLGDELFVPYQVHFDTEVSQFRKLIDKCWSKTYCQGDFLSMITSVWSQLHNSCKTKKLLDTITNQRPFLS